MKPSLPKKPRHIAILRLSALGDVCNLVPTVRALQRHWPEARITWIIGKGEHSLLAGLSGVEFVVFDKATGLAGMRRIWRELADTRFDVLLHMQQAIRASLLSLGLKADVRVGFDKARAKDFQHWFTQRQIAPRQHPHVLESFMDFARLLGVTDDRLEWNLAIPDTAFDEARALAGPAPYLVINPCSNARLRNFRNWSVEGYASVIEHAYRQHGLRSVLTGGGSAVEREMADAIEALCPPGSVVNAIGGTSLKGVLALIKEARAVIAPDTGPAHMGNALGTPTLGLYATTNPRRAAPYLWRDFAVDAYPEAVRTYLDKSVKEVSWGQRVRHADAMDLIKTDAVIAKLDALLAHTAASPTTGVSDES
ncbi:MULTISPECIES: glycosyltransferase family 9 protein [unclassified Halomonas]|uniref:glycosyltransferase family 9 protein n=1 Tax=unclassified Halomonas TaxID=2609666 RepID=UPI00209D73E3|nr:MULTISPECIES: glycosyltransferase family 9 protein [unclassified Halomonas]MCP1315812.1 glycosyltransferase family 9 protein [Halomonas sp. 707D7]MCP1328027.1 glycosyltransferase family 9 protein [Halomonas sp. 707D4]